MGKYIITIPVESDIDPSELLDIALEFGKFVEDQASEECSIDDDEVSVEAVEG